MAGKGKPAVFCVTRWRISEFSCRVALYETFLDSGKPPDPFFLKRTIFGFEENCLMLSIKKALKELREPPIGFSRIL